MLLGRDPEGVPLTRKGRPPSRHLLVSGGEVIASVGRWQVRGPDQSIASLPRPFERPNEPDIDFGSRRRANHQGIGYLLCLRALGVEIDERLNTFLAGAEPLCQPPFVRAR